MKTLKTHTHKTNFIIRPACITDLPHIIQLIWDDPLGKTRENLSTLLLQNYIDAINEIMSDKNAELLVIDNAGDVIGTAQINYLRYINYQGGMRAQIESVRVHKNFRSQGLGRMLFNDLIERAKRRKCRLMQLATDKARPEALRFYEKLGFQLSHHGLKLHLQPNT